MMPETVADSTVAGVWSADAPEVYHELVASASSRSGGSGATDWRCSAAVVITTMAVLALLAPADRAVRPAPAGYPGRSASRPA